MSSTIAYRQYWNAEEYGLYHGAIHATSAVSPLHLLGFLSSPASVTLLIDMIVAILTNAISTLPERLSPLNRLDDFLYLPEVLYVLFFVWLICSGPGKFSVDYWLAGKLLS